MKSIYCVGAANIDYKLKTINSLELATSNPVHAVTTYGGVARNVAENLLNLTQQISLQTVVGNDADGQRLLLSMQEQGCHTDASLILKDQLTSRYYAVLDPAGELHIALAAMELYEQVSLQAFTQCWHQWAQGSIIFLDTCLPASILEHAIEISNRQQWVLCIDPVSVAKAKKLPSDLNGVFLIKPDRREAEALTGMRLQTLSDCIQAGEKILKRGVKNVVISLGKSGYVVVNQELQKHFPACPVNNILDVSGAGDAFFAGILYGLQHDWNLAKSCRFGAATAALTVQSYQTVIKNLTLKNVLNLLDLLNIEEKNDEKIF